MTWSVTELVAWQSEVEAYADRRGKFDWLEIPPIASATAIQDAYHTIARTRHPDLFVGRIEPEVMDRLVRMYSRVTAAYADLKEPERCAAYLRELRGPRAATTPPPLHGQAPLARRLGATLPPMRSEISSHRPGTPATATTARIERFAPPPPTRPAPTTAPPPSPPAPVPVPAPPPAPTPRQVPGEIDPAHAMNARALAYYRRAEGAQHTGDRAVALLHIKMAIAADPRSTFLRAALAELSRP